MKLKKILAIILMLVISLSIGVFATTENVVNDFQDDETIAEEIRSTDVGESDELIDNDYFLLEENIVLENKTILGNAFFMGQTVDITNLDVSGSIFILAQNANISGVKTTGSLYIATEKTIIENAKFKNIYSASRTADIGLGTILDKNVYSVAQDITFNGSANSDVSLAGEDITIGNNAVIEGSLNVSSENEPEIPVSASISDFNFEKSRMSDEESFQDENKLSSTLRTIITYVLVVGIIAVILVNLAPNFTEKVRNYEIKDFIKSVSLGFAIIVLVPIISIVLAFTGVAFRFSFAILLIYILAFLIATPIACYEIANIIAKKFEKTEKKMIILYTLVVSLVYALVRLIPGIGFILEIVLGLLGYGGIFLSIIPKKDK